MPHPVLTNCAEQLGDGTSAVPSTVAPEVLSQVVNALAQLPPTSLRHHADRDAAMFLGLQVLYQLNVQQPGRTTLFWQRLAPLLGDASLGWGDASVSTLRWWCALWPDFQRVPQFASLLTQHGWFWLERYHGVRHHVVGTDQPLAKVLVEAVWASSRVSLAWMRRLSSRSLGAEALCACWLDSWEDRACPPAAHWVHGWLPEQQDGLEAVAPRLADALAHHPTLFHTTSEDLGFTRVELEPSYQVLHRVWQHRWGLNVADGQPWEQAVVSALAWMEERLPRDIPGELVFARRHQLGVWLIGASRDRLASTVEATREQDEANRSAGVREVSREVVTALREAVRRSWWLPTTPHAWRQQPLGVFLLQEAPEQLASSMRPVLSQFLRDAPPSLSALQRCVFPQHLASRWAQVQLALLVWAQPLPPSAFVTTRRVLLRLGVEEVPRALWEGFGHWLAVRTTQVTLDTMQRDVQTGLAWLLGTVPELDATAAMVDALGEDRQLLLKVWWVAQRYARAPQALEPAVQRCRQLMHEVAARFPQTVLASCLPLGCQHQPVPAWLAVRRLGLSQQGPSRSAHRHAVETAVRSSTSLPKRCQGPALACLGLRVQRPWARWDHGAWLLMGVGVAALTSLSWSTASRAWPIGWWCAVVLVSVSGVIACCVVGLRQRAARLEAKRWVHAQGERFWQAQLPSDPLPPAVFEASPVSEHRLRAMTSSVR